MQSTSAFEYFNQYYTDAFLRGVFPDPAPLTRRISLPDIGSHLVTPRLGFTHHGIYIGEEKVIHYSGLAKGLNSGSGPVKTVSLAEFSQNRGFNVELHRDIPFSADEIVHRAKTRLGEGEYNLIFNNCEHFVSWCIYNVNTSTQVDSAFDATLDITKCTTLTVLKKASPIVAAGSAAIEAAKHISAYIKGDINGEELVNEIGHTAITTTSSFYYAGLGQVAIPIPVLGALIGAAVGFFVGNMLHKSGHIALVGDSYIVKQAKERRRRIEKLCEKLIPEIKRSREELEKFIDTHFAERSVDLKASFACLDSAAGNWDPDAYAEALESIGQKFGESFKLQSFEEFNCLMASDEPLKL